MGKKETSTDFWIFVFFTVHCGLSCGSLSQPPAVRECASAPQTMHPRPRAAAIVHRSAGVRSVVVVGCVHSVADGNGHAGYY